MIEIVQKDNPVLRRRAKSVDPGDIPSQKIQRMLEDMKEALDSQEDGVALAAPQINESFRIFIVSEKVFTDPKEKSTQDRKAKQAKKLIFINPTIVKRSRKKKWMEEGCLSVRWLYGETKRSEKTMVRAYDEKGALFTYGGGGLMSQIFQHEIEHLDGILFCDHAQDLREIPEEEIKKREH